MNRTKRVVAVALTSAMLLGTMASAALAVNDPIVPGDECSASTTAVGHPASVRNQTPETAANPPFSQNNPGESTGAEGSANSRATEHCPNAQP
jgi:hypothetical protein